MTTLSLIQEKQPLVLNLANSVTQQRVADVLSFIGASPLMTSATDELKELLDISSALVLNTGTINEETLVSFQSAARLANQMGKPIILDPVAVMMPYRASAVSRLLEQTQMTIIRGNAAEIAWFAKEQVASKGIDALDDAANIENAKAAALATGSIIVQTGKVDVITDGIKVMTVTSDSPFFKVNVGAGDMLSALIAAFAAASAPTVAARLEAAFEATRIFGQAGEIATKQVNGSPANFINQVLDVLYQLAQAEKKVKVL